MSVRSPRERLDCSSMYLRISVSVLFDATVASISESMNSILFGSISLVRIVRSLWSNCPLMSFCLANIVAMSDRFIVCLRGLQCRYKFVVLFNKVREVSNNRVVTTGGFDTFLVFFLVITLPVLADFYLDGDQASFPAS